MERKRKMSGARSIDHEQGPRRAVSALVERRFGSPARALEEIAPGLGRRRFFRVRLDAGAGRPQSVIARVEPAIGSQPGEVGGIAAEPPLEPIRAFLAAHGLPVPARHASDAEAGIELLEDLGDQSLESAAHAASPQQRSALYASACSLIPRLQALTGDAARIAAFGRRLDAALIESKGHKLTGWALPELLGRALSPGEREGVWLAFQRIARSCETAPLRLAHRDFKAANLHLRLRAGGEPPELVMIDIQGAFLAPPEYDLVCLLRDSQVALPEHEVRALLERTRPRLPDAPDRASFERRFDLLTLSRVGKDIAHYIHAASGRGDQRYLRFVANGLRNLRAASLAACALDAAFTPLAELIEAASRSWRHDEAPEGGGPCAR